MVSCTARILCLVALAAGAVPGWAQAQKQTPIYRCVGAHGEPEFSGRPCGSPMPAAGAVIGTGVGSEGHAFGDVCPGSPDALRQAIAGAFESRDVNRLSGVMLWRGVDQASARQILRALSDWVKQPLAGIAVAHANGPPLAGDPSFGASAGAVGEPVPPPTAIGFQVSTADGATRDFGITESDGCWWLTFD